MKIVCEMKVDVFYWNYLGVIVVGGFVFYFEIRVE